MKVYQIKRYLNNVLLDKLKMIFSPDVPLKKTPKISVRLYLSGHFNVVTNKFNHMVRSWNLSGRDLGQAV